jgi:hypothetical protein
MNKAEQIKQQHKELQEKITPENLRLLKQQSIKDKMFQYNNGALVELQKNINAALKPITESVSVWQKMFPENPLLESLNNLSENSLTKQLQKQLKLFDTLNNLDNMFPKYDWLKWNLPQYKPLYEYGLGLQAIQIKYTTPEIVKSFQSIRDLAIEIEKAKTEAENNFWYNLTVEEYDFEKEKDKEKITELEQKVIELEKTIEAYQLVISEQQPQPKAQKTLSQTLRPNITQSQIARLYEYMKGIFEATPEQWRALFSETEIQLSKPIKARAVADIVVLFHHLREREFVETSKYPSVLERAKAFLINDKIVTAKMINKPKSENYNFPLIGKNYDNISKAVASL